MILSPDPRKHNDNSKNAYLIIEFSAPLLVTSSFESESPSAASQIMISLNADMQNGHFSSVRVPLISSRFLILPVSETFLNMINRAQSDMEVLKGIVRGSCRSNINK
jgi:hypothetical protein